jgi:hypothetical protein
VLAGSPAPRLSEGGTRESGTAETGTAAVPRRGAGLIARTVPGKAREGGREEWEKMRKGEAPREGEDTKRDPSEWGGQGLAECGREQARGLPKEEALPRTGRSRGGKRLNRSKAGQSWVLGKVGLPR